MSKEPDLNNSCNFKHYITAVVCLPLCFSLLSLFYNSAKKNKTPERHTKGLTQFPGRLCDVTLICEVSKFLSKHGPSLLAVMHI